MSEMLIGVLSMPDELFWSNDPATRHQHNQIRKEAAKEIADLRAVWEAASDYLLAERNAGFSQEHGGLGCLKATLVATVTRYEQGASIAPIAAGGKELDG